MGEETPKIQIEVAQNLSADIKPQTLVAIDQPVGNDQDGDDTPEASLEMSEILQKEEPPQKL